MVLKNAIKKLAKFGGVEQVGNKFLAVKDGFEVSFRTNGHVADDVDIVCEKMRRVTDMDETQSDYHAGSYYPNLSWAIASAEREIAAKSAVA